MDTSVEVWADLGHTVEDEHVIDHLRLGQFVALDRSLGETVWIGTRSGVVASAGLIVDRRFGLWIRKITARGAAVPDLNRIPHVEIGRAHIPIGEVLDWQPGTFFSLSNGPDTPLPLVRGGLTLAHGLLAISEDGFHFLVTRRDAEVNEVP
jgi:flagellar motor switch/type III secretory pathway protein FliN